jgi:hypothetical protein
MIERFIVAVGKKAKEIPVITSIAVRSSKFFKAALEHDWKEAREKRVSLPETRVEAFEGYLQWLYTGQITFTNADPNPDPTLTHHWFIQSVYFFVLGDYLDDLKFRHAVLDYVATKFVETECPPGPGIIQLVWDSTTPDSPLRRLFLDFWSCFTFEYSITHILGLASHKPQYDKEFVKQHFERLVSANELGQKKGTKKTVGQVIANFKLKVGF